MKRADRAVAAAVRASEVAGSEIDLGDPDPAVVAPTYQAKRDVAEASLHAHGDPWVRWPVALFGATIDHVVDETLFVTAMAAAVAVAGAVRHGVYGEDIIVASTLCALGGPELLVEI